MRRSILLTLGRLPKGLEVARCLKAAGCRVFAADPFGVHLSKPSRAVDKSFRVTAPQTDQAGFLNDILSIIEDCKIDIVIPVSEEVPHVAQLAGRLPDRTRLLCPEPSQLLRLHDKYAFIQAAHAAGLDTPETYKGDDQQAQSLCASADYVVKPSLGCSGTGLRLAKAGEPLLEHEHSDDMVVQRRIHGRELSSFSFVRDGKVLGTAVYEGLIYAGTVSVCFERLTNMEAIESWITSFVAAEKYNGFIAFDFIIDAAGKAYPIECNPRLTSGVHFLNHDDLAKAVLDETPPAQIRFCRHMRMQEGHTGLTKAYAALPNIAEFFRRLKVVFTSRDVLWSAGDPLPFILMTPMSWPVLRQAIFGGKSLGEAATADIEWLPHKPLKHGPTDANQTV